MPKKKKQNFTKPIFWILIAVFIFLIFGIFFELSIGKIFLLEIFILIILSIILIILTKKEKIKGKLKKYYLITGYSAIAMVASIILHNLFYALTILSENINVVHMLMEGLHVAFFFIAIPLAPIVFIYGMIRSIILIVKK